MKPFKSVRRSKDIKWIFSFKIITFGLLSYNEGQINALQLLNNNFNLSLFVYPTYLIFGLFH